MDCGLGTIYRYMETKDNWEEMRNDFIVRVFEKFQKRLGKKAQPCPDCGGSMYTMCEKVLREMYAQGMDKTAKHFKLKYEEALQKREEELRQRIQTYKSYYNPIGDDLNRGKHMAMDDVLALLESNK